MITFILGVIIGASVAFLFLALITAGGDDDDN